MQRLRGEVGLMASPSRDRAFSVNRPLTSRRRRHVVENDDYTAFIGRVIRAYSRRVAAGDIDAVADMIQTAADLDAAIHQAVLGLRRTGYSWAEIGMRLAISRQAAQQRWGR